MTKISNTKIFHNLKQNKKAVLLSLLVISSAFLFFSFDKNKTNIYFYLGNKFFEGRIMGQRIYNLDLAEYFLKKSVENENKMWAYYQLSRISFIRGDLYDAVLYADKELAAYKDNCRTHYIRGLAYAYMDILDNAISDFNIFNKCFPASWAGHNDLAWFYFRKGDVNSVIRVIDEVKDYYIDNPWINTMYGAAQMNVKNYDVAKEYLNRAKAAADSMTPADWGVAYPGNDSRIYEKGLNSMRSTINSNLELIEKLENN